MRLRHIPGCEEFIANSSDCISGEEVFAHRGEFSALFKRKLPIHIEIGMGKGQFIRNMAEANKDINYIGIERYESVLMKAIQRKRARENERGEYENLIFMCVDAMKLSESFGQYEVERIYLNFSDPWPKARHASRRLTSPEFMAVYDRILKSEGRLEFKTDNNELFEYSLESVQEAGWRLCFVSRNLHGEDAESLGEHDYENYVKGNIMTEYEEKFSLRGQKINKLVAVRDK